MTVTSDAWKIVSATDGAWVRAAVADVVTAGRAPALARARFLTDLTARLRRCVRQGGEWEVGLHIRQATAGREGELTVRFRPIVQPVPDQQDEPPLVCPLAHGPVRARTGRRPPLSEALWHADDNTSAVLDRLDEQTRLVEMYRHELHQTNQGVLALHSDLAAAALAQRDLFQAERAARAEAERARRLLTFLADASATITASLSHSAILGCLSDLLVPEYAAELDVWLFDQDRTEGTRGGREHPAAAVVAARTGRPQHAAARPGNLPGIHDLAPSALSERPLLAVPLAAHDLLGVLTLTAPGPRFDPDTSVMLVELAHRVAIALDHARRYEQYRVTAETLQHAQLTDLPTAPGLLMTARYLPATRGLNIGGDWYDVFHQPDGSLLAVIGDVTGHGLRAAVVMGQLRTALRAYAVEDGSPGEILTRLHRMLRHLQPELYATAVIARIRPGHSDVVWASAGHPPPVVRDANGTVRVLDTKPGVMLGVPVAHTYADQTAELPPGSSLLLYTDGLVERRSRGMDVGIEALSRILAAVSTQDLEQDMDAAADDLLTSLLRDSARDDDVCLLLCHSRAAAGRAGGQEAAGASDGGHRARRSRGGSDDGKAAVRGVQDRQELRQL
jgi:serine phosphatase RsbU (regulator of sigma subunit)